MTHEKKVIIGLTEKITIIGSEGSKQVMAKIDTGSSKSSIDSRLAGELSLGPVLGTSFVKSAHGNSLRPILKASIVLDGKKITARFSLADRSHLKYRILIGQNILKNSGFLIDPSKF